MNKSNASVILKNSLYKMAFCCFLLYQLLNGSNLLAQTISPSGTATFCAGGAVTLTVNGAPAGANFQ
jgi:hypothetical protein